MEKYGGNLPPRKKLRKAPAPRPKAGSPLKPLATPQALATAKEPAPIRFATPQQRKKFETKKSGSLPVLKDAVGLARAGVHAVRAIEHDVVHHPGQAAVKSVKQAQDIAKGVAGAALALPAYTVEYPVAKAFGKAGPESPGHKIKRMVGGEAKLLKEKYGPSFEGKPGAYKKLEKRVEQEGPLSTTIDVATVAAPLSSGVGRLAKLGEIARPAVRVNPLGAATAAKARPSVVGAAAQGAHNTARRVAQANAKARATQRHRVRVLNKVGVKPRHMEGRAPSILNTEPKPLTARRANLKPGEVAPLSEKAANRTVRLRVAERDYRAKEHGKVRAAAAAAELRKPFRKLTPEQEHAAVTAAALGIKDSAGARNVIPLKIAEIERSRAAALAGKTKDVKAEKRGAKQQDPGELPAFQNYLAHPEVFDHPGVQAAADAVRARRVGAREGLGPQQAASARSKHVGRTLGVKTAAELHAEAKVAYAERLAAADATVAAKRAAVEAQGRALHDAKLLTREAAVGKGRIRISDPATLKAISRHEAKRPAAGLKAARREVAVARAALAEATGRAQVLHRNVTGRELRAGETPAGGVIGVQQAQRRLAAAESALAKLPTGALKRVAGHGEGLVRHAHGLDVAKQELRAARQARAEIAREAPKRAGESPTQYEARVVARAKEIGLAAPEYTPSHFEQRGLRPDTPGTLPKNPMGRTKSGKLYRLGREHKTLDAVEQSTRASLKRGAALEQQSKLLEEFGKFFPNKEAADKWAEGLGLRTEEQVGALGRKVQPDIAIHTPEGPVTPSTGARARKGNKAQAGDYVHTDGVFAVPRAVKEELDALKVVTNTPAGALRKLAHYPQTALLALSPSWWQFQRANDAIALGLGGALPHAPRLTNQLRALDPASREVVHVLAGGGISSELLTPLSVQKIGRVQRVLDENPTYREALASRKPATLLLKAGHDAPTALLRSDRAITGGARELQLLHNLNKIAARMDPKVSTIARAFGPIGHAFKTGDAELIQKLLKDPAYQAKLEEATKRLTEVHGDWHTYTAREQKLKHYAAFYGFLRYATRMAFLTLPINHPYVGLLVAQLGKMGSDDARKIIGPDLPYGLSALYNDNGTIAADFTRANPLLGPLMSVTKPEQVLSLGTPLASIALNYLFNQPLALNDSSEGRVTQYTYEGDPNNHAGGGLLGKNRLRMGAAQVLGLLGPVREWQKFDPRQQSSDSLPWDRRYLSAHDKPAQQYRIDQRNAATEGGVGGLVHDLFPLVAPGSKKNMKVIGQGVTAAKRKAAQAEELRQAKRYGLMNTPAGRAQQRLDAVDRRIAEKQKAVEARLDEADRRVQIKLLRKGLTP